MTKLALSEEGCLIIYCDFARVGSCGPSIALDCKGRVLRPNGNRLTQVERTKSQESHIEGLDEMLPVGHLSFDVVISDD